MAVLGVFIVPFISTYAHKQKIAVSSRIPAQEGREDLRVSMAGSRSHRSSPRPHRHTLCASRAGHRN